MNFGEALAALKAGRKVVRDGWNGKQMFLLLVPETTILIDGVMTRHATHIALKTMQGYCVPWVCSQTDMLHEDWDIID